MSKRIVLATSILGLFGSSLSIADVTMEMVTRNTAGQETERTRIFAQEGNIRMDEQERGARTSVIFRGEEFLVLDHKDQSYIVMDEAMLNEVSAQISEAMKQMEAQLAGMPPEQRAMAEQMMKGQLQGMMGQQEESAPPPRVEAIGSGQWKTYSCRNYAVYERGEKTQEICAAALSQVDGSDEMMEAFRAMAGFITKMTESMPMRGDGDLNPGELMDQIDGFPVRTIEYEGGEISGEVSIESVTEEDLDPNLFIVPGNYKRTDPLAGRR